MVKTYNELTRVQLPAVLHLVKLGYKYFSYKQNKQDIDTETNIFVPECKRQFLKLNPEATDSDFEKEFKDIKLELGYNDLGRSFFNRIQGTSNSNYKFIDWENFNNNSFKIAIEVPCINGEEEFRPDITVFINGLPLSYIEVKQPNAIRDKTTGMKSEFNRMTVRFKNQKFRKFHNITQLICFSDNMPYADDEGQQMQGSYYATTSLGKAIFNSMHEERYGELVDRIGTISDQQINEVLKDANKIVLKNSPEFKTNCKNETPMNMFLTSMYDRQRLQFFLRFGMTYVDTKDKNGNEVLQKHIMRYPQFFATRAVADKINEGVKKGVIWHTQGSGKTALAFFNIRYLRYLFQKKNIIPRFYFVVDRLDLATQASKAFKERGLKVKLISNKRQLNKPFSEDISVVNIQKVNEDTDLTNKSGYDLNTQNIYFIDEAHRSYNEKGSYLPNLYNADKKSIKIALTGTPLINIDHKGKKTSRATTKEIFGDYIHKYYYNQSIQDGYTLRLMREEIETSYKHKLRDILNGLSGNVEKGSLNKRLLYSNPKFVSPMLDYILDDFVKSRDIFGDQTIGGMIVAQSSEQAREMYKEFQERQRSGKTKLTASLILSDKDDKETRGEEVEDFKKGKTDLLIVYNMLLTGFNAPRLKKLYLGRMIKAHNLLQALTRVNRPYKDFRMGYIVDFANISKEFDKTNHAYFEELNSEYNSDLTDEKAENIYGSLFVPAHEIEDSLNQATIILSQYDTGNLENFSQQVSETPEKKDLLELKNTLEKLKEYYNISRLMSYTDLTEKIKAVEVPKLLKIVSDRLMTLNLIFNAKDDSSDQLLEMAMNKMDFSFKKVGEVELQLAANDFVEKQRQAASALGHNWDQKDPEWISLYEEFTRVLEKQHIGEMTTADTKLNTTALDRIIKRINNLNAKNRRLATAFNGDKKFARTYKYVIYKKKGIAPSSVAEEPVLYKVMKKSKDKIDNEVSKNQNMVVNKAYFNNEAIQSIRQSSREENTKIPVPEVKEVSSLLTEEYDKEYQGVD
ncbi:DEAD/DEAH box helicase family protein [Limosilactobacillus reuteri]|uniref:DEAD/DEAH box helicase family protein n=1 Tax=Limosilactobacillus reuteri TaxID=1598 RepID=UPI00214BCC63|nr:DEAD/DEAH box helicase family protein [Limosilactobacillus reuteri]MCR1862216.1 DEAD/DEAH box helicase family protein [Limosilactobacillus reuteri]MCR1891867.1 DEAD/DEAH box helicase family protein [Limosilactobacillus reuteri]